MGKYAKNTTMNTNNQPQKSNFPSLKMGKYTKNTTVNTNNMGMNMQSTSLESKEMFLKKKKLLKMITKLEVMTTRTFTKNMMETIMHIIKDMQTIQKHQKPTAK